MPIHRLLRILCAAIVLLLALLFTMRGRWAALPSGAPVYAAAAQPLTPKDGGPNRLQLRGILLAVPADGSGIGAWQLQIGNGSKRAFLSDSNTRFDDGIPAVDSRVRVEATIQADNTLLATRIRADAYEAGEIVARLATDVLSTTIASRYHLIPKATLLASGHIYLFATPNIEDEPGNFTDQMKSDPDVVWSEFNYVGSAPEGDPYKIWRWGGVEPSGFVDQVAFTQVNLAPALAKYQGAGVVVAVLDTGVDLNHPAFVGRLQAGWDMVDDDDTPQDEGDGPAWGHGTHIAGIIARIAPESMIMPVRVLDSTGRGNTFTLAYAIEWATAHGANVINLSLGTSFDSQVLHEAIENALDQGVLIVAAAGNSNTDQPQYPVSYPRVIGVTAVDEVNSKASFANFSHQWVDVAAPGVGITSTIIGPQGSGYASWSGTSMAAAFVSGAAALEHERLPNASAVIVRQLLHNTAQNIDSQNPRYVGELGGLLDIGAALVNPPQATATPGPTPSTPTPTATPKPGSAAKAKLYLPLVKR